MEARIRLAERRELDLLPDVERAAGRRFLEIAETAGIPEDVSPMEELVHAHGHGHVWVATLAERIVGFAYGTRLDGNFHLEELDVLPEFGRRGIGTALVRTVIHAAREAGFSAVTLSTFRHVAWNAPFYARLGFVVVPQTQLSGELARAFLDEERRGLPIEIRVVMRLDLA